MVLKRQALTGPLGTQGGAKLTPQRGGTTEFLRYEPNALKPLCVVML